MEHVLKNKFLVHLVRRFSPGDYRARDHMVVGFTTTCAITDWISAYHH